MILARLRYAPWEPAVFPFADDAGSLLIGTSTLRDLQREEAAAAGLELKDVAADAPLPDGVVAACTLDAVFSRETLAHLMAAARAGGVAQAGLAPGTPLYRAATRLVDVSGAFSLPLWAGAFAGQTAATAASPALAFAGGRLVALDDDGSIRVRVPPYGKPPHVLELPLVRKLGGRVTHWLHALDLSLAAKDTARLRLGLVDAATGQSRRNLVGKKVNIHPTATVIGSILADGVRLEQHASVIGDNCRTLVDTSLRRVVAMTDSTLSNLGISDLIVGRNVFLTTSVATFADPGVDVVVEGKDTGRAHLGGAIGARCVLGSRALMKAGTALPPGLLVVARPEEAAGKLDEAGLARSALMFGNPRDNH